MKVPVSPLFWVVYLLSANLAEVCAGNKKCTNPKGMDGDSYREGCIKKTCKSGIWRPSLEAGFCCFNGEAYPHGSTITSISNGCSTAVLHCRDGRDNARISLEVENNCGKYSTEKQVSELKSMLENHMKNTDCYSTSTTTSESATTTTTTSEMPTRTGFRKGILVSGGWGAETSVEIFNPETGESCSLPDLPDNRNGHTMDIVHHDLAGDPPKILVCGGGDWESQTSCLIMKSDGSYSWDHFSVIQRRDGHISWIRGHTSNHNMLLLMGGEHSRTSTETVVDPSDSYSGFSLVQDTRYACSIMGEGNVILTGGRDTMNVVAMYDNNGFVQSLPKMNEGRRYHACGSYDVDGNMVLLVAGGRGGDYNNIIASTEKLTFGASGWTTVEPLPRLMIAMASVSLHNKVFVTGGGRGGRDDEHSRRSEVLAFDGNHWEEIGHLQFARNFHAATVIDLSIFPELCTPLCICII